MKNNMFTYLMVLLKDLMVLNDFLLLKFALKKNSPMKESQKYSDVSTIRNTKKCMQYVYTTHGKKGAYKSFCCTK